MAAAPQIVSLSEYLHTSYRPDCDFVDDHIEERNLGELDHASWIIDPAERRGFDFSSGSWTASLAFHDAATGLHLDLPALFAAIDEDQAR